MYKTHDPVILPDGRKTTVLRNLLGSSCEVKTGLGVFPEGDLVRDGDEENRTGVVRVPNDRSSDSSSYYDPTEVRDQIREALLELPLDFRGHFKSGKQGSFFLKMVVKGGHNFAETKSLAESQALLAALKGGPPLDHWIDVVTMRIDCPYCLSHLLETNGSVLRFKEACTHPNGFGRSKWTLNVPSGVLVTDSHHLYDLFKLPNGAKEPCINSLYGHRKMTLMFAEVGLVHIPVWSPGEGSLIVYDAGGGKYEVAAPGSDQKTYKMLPHPKGYQDVSNGGITSNSWLNLCDKEEYLRRCVYFKVEPVTLKEISVEPGLYEFERYDDVRSSRTKCPVALRFKKIGPALPDQDLLASYRDVKITPFMHLMHRVRTSKYSKLPNKKTSWSDLTEVEKRTAWLAEANQVFFSDSKHHWHRNGFPSCPAQPVVVNEPIPPLRTQSHWFFHGYSGWASDIQNMTLSPEYAEFAHRMLESIVSFGAQVDTSYKDRQVWIVRKLMQEALTTLRILVVKYPEQADPEYVWWLAQESRAESWVENFPLGPDKIASLVQEEDLEFV